jgi:hypothetical protein
MRSARAAAGGLWLRLSTGCGERSKQSMKRLTPATTFAITVRHDLRGRPSCGSDGWHSIVRIRGQHQLFESCPWENFPRIIPPGRVQFRVGHHMFQIGIFGPAITYDLSGRLDLPIGKRIPICLAVHYLDTERPVIDLGGAGIHVRMRTGISHVPGCPRFRRAGPHEVSMLRLILIGQEPVE